MTDPILVKKSVRQNREACETCGTYDLYWAKDTTNNIEWVLIDKTYATTAIRRGGVVPSIYTHAHQPARRGASTASTPPAYVAPEPVAEPVASTYSGTPLDPPASVVSTSVAEPVASTDPTMTSALDALRRLLGIDLDPEKIKAMVEGQVSTRLDEYGVEFRSLVEALVAEVAHPVNTVVINGKTGDPTRIDGLTHKDQADVIGFLEDGHVYLVGPAGTGKTEMAAKAAKARGASFWAISMTQQTPVSALAGYMNATGEYVETGFYRAVIEGGVVLVDEADHGHANTVGFANAAMSNGEVGFPCGMVTVHPDFRVVMAANTYGQGGNILHSGATALDAATLNRVGKLFIDYDESLENSMVAATGLDSTTQAKVLRFVRAIRANAALNPSFKVVASPRNSVRIAKALQRGVSWDRAVEVHLTAGIKPEHLEKLIG